MVRFPQLAILALFALGSARAVVAADTSPLLPLGTELGDEAFDRPREAFRSEDKGGRKPYVVLLGDAAFSSPLLLGGRARAGGISCNTCHVNGTTNALLYVPGLSTRSGNFDTTNALFNPHTDNGVIDPLNIPSLRGAHLLAPYGHDGRTLSLTEFVRNVIVNEFAGDEPSHEILDAVVAYVDDIDFIPNPRIATAGRLTEEASQSELRGEALFYKPFAQNPDLSCAGCHIPSAAFVDHRQHDVGSGGLFKTPTLLNANDNAPYFHDGRYTTYAQVVGYFDRTFSLKLSAQDRQDLVAYLHAIGDGQQSVMPDTIDAHTKEITDFMSVLDTAIPQKDAEASLLAIDAVDRELRELTEYFPDARDPTLSDGVPQRLQARGAVKGLVLDLREVADKLKAARSEEALAALKLCREDLAAAQPALQAAQPYSLFDRKTHDAHFAAMRRLNRAATDPKLAPHRLDND
jgi:cytochrome c peroxidase